MAVIDEPGENHSATRGGEVLTAKTIAGMAGGRVIGDPDQEVDGIATLATAAGRDLAFVDDARVLAAALTSGAGIIIAGPFAEGADRPGAIVVCSQPRLAFARAARRIRAADRPPADLHNTAVIHPSARLGEGVAVGAHAVIDADVVLGDRVTIGPLAHICHGVEIGPDTCLDTSVVVYAGTTIGARVIVRAGSVLGSDGFGYVRDDATGRYEPFPQVGRLVVEDDVEFGTLCTVDRGALGETRIKRGTKIDNQVHVAHNVAIGEDVVIAAQTGVAGSSVIEDRVVIAGQVGIADHVRIEAGAILGAQCGVPSRKTIKGPGVLFWGTPARPIKQYLKELATLARLARK